MASVPSVARSRTATLTPRPEFTIVVVFQSQDEGDFQSTCHVRDDKDQGKDVPCHGRAQRSSTAAASTADPRTGG